MTTDILQCPFCGSTTGKLIKVGKLFAVICELSTPRAMLKKKECCVVANVTTGVYADPEQCIKEWNDAVRETYA